MKFVADIQGPQQMNPDEYSLTELLPWLCRLLFPVYISAVVTRRLNSLFCLKIDILQTDTDWPRFYLTRLAQFDMQWTWRIAVITQ